VFDTHTHTHTHTHTEFVSKKYRTEQYSTIQKLDDCVAVDIAWHLPSVP